ncbi:MAG TPA: Gfo/Idh/MocA family oxidoreductase [Balneolaceae bacterium]|nr:Gfo/Idh/MocA family oxidoreductase [Balneolaceae bacterium]
MEDNKKESSKKESEKKEISRRDFIKDSALGAAAFTIVPRFVLGGKDYVAPSDKLYIACVGCGGEAHNDIQHYAYAPKNNAKIAFLCDVDDKRAAQTRKEFPDVPYYHDWRKLFDKEHKNFDAVSVAIPDHNHAIVGLNAMKMHKHLYLQKPLTHDIYEARLLTKAAKKYKVVTQMGNQGASFDGVRTLKEWFDAGLIGEIEKVYNWTDRPVWPQGIPWPNKHPKVPDTLDWNLWLGTAPETKYIDNLVPFNWRGWWRFGTGALGDMACHIMGPSFKLLGIRYPTEVTCRVSKAYSGIFKEADYPRSIPRSQKFCYKFKRDNGKELKFYWMDGGFIPDRPDELDPDVNMNKALAGVPKLGGFEGGTLFIGTKGKISCGWGGRNPRLLPLSLNNDIDVPKKYPRVHGSGNGHWWQWVNAAIAGYHNDYKGNAALPILGKEKAYVDSPFEGYAGPLTETVLMGNLLSRSFGIQNEQGNHPGRYIAYKWDGPNMKVTNFKPANQYVKRTYRKGWGPLKL